jgi:phage shock protein PspC (stress-responsive transcriptional regulator)
MLLLVRLGAYLTSGFVLWHAFHDTTLMPIFPIGRHLLLDPEQGMIFGVCSGISNFTGIDVTCIRVLWVLVALYRGIGIVLYILAFLLMPLPE